MLVTDETGRPVANAAVSFRLPEDGPGGMFSSGPRTEANDQGSGGARFGREHHAGEDHGRRDPARAPGPDSDREAGVISASRHRASQEEALPPGRAGVLGFAAGAAGGVDGGVDGDVG